MHDPTTNQNPRAFDLDGADAKGLRMVGGEKLRGDLPAGAGRNAGSTDQGNVVLGIDPGANTGMATYHDGKLVSLKTIRPHQMREAIVGADMVVFEDSRLTSFMFTTVKSRPVALNMARKVGQVDAFCSLIVAICEELGIPCIGISPKQKGAKLNAEQFEHVTGWMQGSNQHGRDAAMCAFPYRRAA